MKFLFIGNSHTFRNDMPHIFQMICEKNGIDAQVTMLAHGGKNLAFHQAEPEVRFNILYGNYDYIILQDRQKDFSPDGALEAGTAIDQFIQQTPSKKILYMPWTVPQEKMLQAQVAGGYYRLGRAIHASVAPVGLLWWEYMDRHPGENLFMDDNRHATPKGSTLAAYTIYQTIFGEPAVILKPEDSDITALVNARIKEYVSEQYIASL